MWYWASTTLMFFVSGCVAQHHFDATAPEGDAAASLSTLPCTLAKLALTTSSGTTSKIALVFEFIAWLRKKAKVSCWNFASPFFYVAVLLKCCVYSCLRLLTKFALIFHVITGDALWSSGKRTAKLVRKAGVDAMVLETTAMNAFGLLAYGLSLSVACLCWFRTAREKGAKFPTSYLGRFPLVSADFGTSDHLSERSRSVDVFSVTRARGTLTLERR